MLCRFLSYLCMYLPVNKSVNMDLSTICALFEVKRQKSVLILERVYRLIHSTVQNSESDYNVAADSIKQSFGLRSFFVFQNESEV